LIHRGNVFSLKRLAGGVLLPAAVTGLTMLPASPAPAATPACFELLRTAFKAGPCLAGHRAES
jgi:hypothetical protein